MSDSGDRIIDEDGFPQEPENEAELEAMRKRVEEMEAEAEKLRELQASLDPASGGDAGTETAEGKDGQEKEQDVAQVDGRSIYVGNVDYAATCEEIQQHFRSCGTINRVTILCDKFSGRAKGYAYVEFSEPAFVEAAVALNATEFRGRQLQVTAKRTNVPGMSARGRGRGRGGYRGGYRGGQGYSPYRGSRGGFRGRGRGY